MKTNVIKQKLNKSIVKLLFLEAVHMFLLRKGKYFSICYLFLSLYVGYERERMAMKADPLRSKYIAALIIAKVRSLSSNKYTEIYVCVRWCLMELTLNPTKQYQLPLLVLR